MTAKARRSGARSRLVVNAWLVLLAISVTLGSAAAFALSRPKEYVATAQVAVGPERVGGTALRPEMASEREIAQSGDVTSRAAAALGRDTGAVVHGLSVSVVLESSILDISFTARTGEAAVGGARACAEAYIDYRNDVAGSRLTRLVTWPETVRPSGTSLPLVLGVALIAGLCLGAGAAWGWDRFADQIRSPEELAAADAGPSVLAEITRWEAGQRLAPPGPAREAFGHLAVLLGSLASRRDGGVSVVVTSPRSGAGTTTVAVNTALAFARQGREVILVGADVHHPELHEILAVPRSPGLLQVLSADSSPDAALRPTRWPQLSVMAVGDPSGDAHPVLHGDMLGYVLDELARRATVIVDSPPLLDSATALVLADKADLVLLVGDLRAGRRADAVHALRLLEGVRGVLTGWVANLPRRTESGTPVPEPGARAAARPLPSAGDRSDESEPVAL